MTTSNSSNLIALRDMVRDLAFVQDLALNGDISWNDYLLHMNGVLNRVGLELGTIDERELTREGGMDQETGNAIDYLRVVKRHRNSLVIEGGEVCIDLDSVNFGRTSESGFGQLGARL